MGVVVCHQCGKDFEDELLCCPHCGEAQIPQMSKAQLRLEQMKASRGPLAAIYIGLGLGLLAGAVYFAITVMNGTASLGNTLASLMAGMMGSALGLLYHRLFLDRPGKRRKRPS
jgi:hypothetical protein